MSSGFMIGPFCPGCGVLLRGGGEFYSAQPCPECGDQRYFFAASVVCSELAEDGTCAHEENVTSEWAPECYEYVCPKKVDRVG
jgi:hypothetical protein